MTISDIDIVFLYIFKKRRCKKMSKDKKEIIEMAREHGLNLKKESLKYNESGLDFQVIMAQSEKGKDWVLRIPRRKDVMAISKKEKEILDFVNGKISIEVPIWEIYTEELIAYQLLTGVPAGTIDPEAEIYIWKIDEKNLPIQFIKTLAEAMVSLHQINLKDFANTGIELKTIDQCRKNMRTRMEKVKEEFNVNQTLWRRWQKWLDDDSLWPDRTALIHGELHAGHILIDDNSSVTGLIDWTEAEVSDIAKDFVAYYMIFGKEALDKLISYYQEAGGYVWPNMMKHIIEYNATYPLDIAEFAIRSGLREYREMARKSLGVK